MALRRWIIKVERIFRYSASSEGKPRSWKTFPLERVIFSFMGHLPSLLFLSTTISDYLLQSTPAQIDLGGRRFPGLLLEPVQHIDSFGKLRDVEHSVFKAGVDPDLVNSGTYRRHWLPIRWLQPLLDKMQEVSSIAASVFREGTDILKRGANPDDGFFVHEGSI